MIYGTIGGGGAATGALAATGASFNTLAEVVAATTLAAAGLALTKLAPRWRRSRG